MFLDVTIIVNKMGGKKVQSLYNTKKTGKVNQVILLIIN